jgi:hypothetical protein
MTLMVIEWLLSVAQHLISALHRLFWIESESQVSPNRLLQQKNMDEGLSRDFYGKSNSKRREIKNNPKRFVR